MVLNLNDVETFPLAPEQCVTGFGTTLVVAPHADDESLGCGGIISLLRKYGQPVYILLLSDGTLSHPNSILYPAEKLRNLRENELEKAAEIMGVSAENLIYCRFKDRSVPNVNSNDFQSAVDQINKLLNIIKPASLFVPWRRDPHPDHRAAFQLVESAKTESVNIYEYPIWLEELGLNGDSPTTEEVMPFRINISSVLHLKQAAISAHVSQTGDLINDDPGGFRLSKEMLDHFKIPYELFFISK